VGCVQRTYTGAGGVLNVAKALIEHRLQDPREDRERSTTDVQQAGRVVVAKVQRRCWGRNERREESKKTGYLGRGINE